MELVNETKAQAGWTMGFQQCGRELLIVVGKATYDIPSEPEEKPRLSDEQVPLVEADEFTGEPGLSALLYETDYAHKKPFCDVLFNGKAYTRSGHPEMKTPVMISVDKWSKAFAVTGTRFWRKQLLTVRPSNPEPFIEMPISYDNAFGGLDNSKENPNDVKTFLTNPVGMGFSYYQKNIDGMPICNTEEIGNPVKVPRGKYNPMALGPIGRSWTPRYTYAGTYDDEWLENENPFFPRDFNYLYFQAAPKDQQIAYPKGGERVTLANLTPQRLTSFLLPKIEMSVIFISHEGKDVVQSSVMDTLVIEPEMERFTMTWRASLPMNKSIFDIKQMVLSEKPDVWQQKQSKTSELSHCCDGETTPPQKTERD